MYIVEHGGGGVRGKGRGQFRTPERKNICCVTMGPRFLLRPSPGRCPLALINSAKLGSANMGFHLTDVVSQGAAAARVRPGVFGSGEGGSGPERAIAGLPTSDGWRGLKELCLFSFHCQSQLWAHKSQAGIENVFHARFRHGRLGFPIHDTGNCFKV